MYIAHVPSHAAILGESTLTVRTLIGPDPRMCPYMVAQIAPFKESLAAVANQTTQALLLPVRLRIQPAVSPKERRMDVLDLLLCIWCYIFFLNNI